MYAFDFAATRISPMPLTIHYPPVPFNKLMAQPPADATAGQACMLHYTWSPIMSDKDWNEVWKFDKRSMPLPLTPRPTPPAWDPSRGFKLQAGEIVTEEGLALMRAMVTRFNEAVRSMPKFPEGTTDAAGVARARRNAKPEHEPFL